MEALTILLLNRETRVPSLVSGLSLINTVYSYIYIYMNRYLYNPFSVSLYIYIYVHITHIWFNYHDYGVAVIGFISSPSQKDKIEVDIALDPT